MEITAHAMTIILNGSAHELAAPVTLDALLESLGLGGKPVVVELNQVAVFPRDYALTSVSEGARVEVVTLAAGG
jgi:thiamine biosynthesis protein ThiS